MERIRYREVSTMLHGHELNCLVPDNRTEVEREAGQEIWTEASREDAERLERLRNWKWMAELAALNAAPRPAPPPVPPISRPTARGGEDWRSTLAVILLLALFGAALGYAFFGGSN